jgi:sugar phosphate permease
MFGNFGAAVSGPLLAYISIAYSWDFMFMVCAGVLCISSVAGFLVDASRPLLTHEIDECDQLENTKA